MALFKGVAIKSTAKSRTFELYVALKEIKENYPNWSTKDALIKYFPLALPILPISVEYEEAGDIAYLIIVGQVLCELSYDKSINIQDESFNKIIHEGILQGIAEIEQPFFDLEVEIIRRAKQAIVESLEPEDFANPKSSVHNSLQAIAEIARTSSDLGVDHPNLRSDETKCFVATAIYNSPNVMEVRVLRSFRDKVLSKYRFGRSFISWYYYHGPAIANYVKEKTFLKRTLKWCLSLVIMILKKIDH